MLDSLGNLGDFIGGIGVVITLVYLAVQVHQNTTQLRDSSKLLQIQGRDRTVESFTAFRSKIVENGDVAEIYYRGLRDYEALEGPDRMRFNLLLNELFNVIQLSMQRADAIGTSTREEVLESLTIADMLRSPGIARWWERNRGAFTPDFVGVVDGLLPASAHED